MIGEKIKVTLNKQEKKVLRSSHFQAFALTRAIIHKGTLTFLLPFQLGTQPKLDYGPHLTDGECETGKNVLGLEVKARAGAGSSISFIQSRLCLSPRS